MPSGRSKRNLSFNSRDVPKFVSFFPKKWLFDLKNWGIFLLQKIGKEAKSGENFFFEKKALPSVDERKLIGTQGVTDRYFVSSYWTFCPVIWLFGDVEL